MKYFKIVLTCVAIISFAQCKKDDGNNGDSAKIFEIYETLNATELKFYENGAATGNYKEAIVLTGQWLETQDGIAGVSYDDSVCIFIKMESGLQTDFCVYETDANGATKFRGGGGGGTFKMPSGNCAHKIENKKVLFFAAAYDDFYLTDPQALQRVVDLFEDSDGDFEVTVLKNEQCTPEVVATFGDYGFVSLETHGMPEGFLTGLKLQIDDPASIGSAADLSAYINSKYGAQYAQWFDEGKLVLGEREYINPITPNWWNEGIAGTFLNHEYSLSVSSLYVKSLPPMPNTIINGNMCYSGYGISKKSCMLSSDIFHDNPIRPAFESLNPISYYCYAFNAETSFKVTDADAKAILWELTNSFLNDGDSTGNAHLTNAGTFWEGETNPRMLSICGPFYYKHFGHDDYCYGGCEDTMIDNRDGQVYKTVCYGNQVWMAENLNWAGAGICISNSPANCDQYGRMYTWAEMMAGAQGTDAVPSGVRGICPLGWHVPSNEEWKLMEKTLGVTNAEYTYTLAANGYANIVLGDAISLGVRTRSADYWDATQFTADNANLINGSDFSALPAGFVSSAANGSLPYSQGSAANFLTATTEVPSNPNPPGTVAMCTRTINSNANKTRYSVQYLPVNEQYYSCRCVKD